MTYLNLYFRFVPTATVQPYAATTTLTVWSIGGMKHLPPPSRHTQNRLTGTRLQSVNF